MKEVDKYLEILTRYSKKKLQEHFEIALLNLNDFEYVNSYLIYQTFKDSKSKNNVLIYIPEKKTRTQFYIPSILTIAIFNFIDNFIDDTTIYSIGDVLQRKGNRYIIVSKTDQSFIITDRGNARITINKKSIRKYLITNANIKNNIVKLKFNVFRDFFTQLLNVSEKELPSKFKYKSVIVTDRNIVSELKRYEFNGEKIHKAFPFRYVTRNGRITDNIPIDPLIYIVNDYFTVREHILDKGIKIRNIIFIGKNKYKDYYIEISQDLNENQFENCLFIGSADIEKHAIPNLLKWNWKLPELNYFKYFETHPINRIEVKDVKFEEAILNFDSCLKKYDFVNLNELYKYVRHVLPITIPDKKSSLMAQLDNTLIHFEKEGEEIVELAFKDSGEYDYEGAWEDIIVNFERIIETKRNSSVKYNALASFERIDFLIVPREYINIWRDEISNRNIKKTITFKEFNQIENIKNKTIVFLGFYGYSHLKSIIFNTNKIYLILYPQEIDYFNNSFNKLKRETINELRNKDRVLLSELSYKEVETTENIEELIERLFKEDDTLKINPDYPDVFTNSYNREISFENDNEILVLDENKTVLVKKGKEWRSDLVKNLKLGQTIKVYDNTTKEELYKIAFKYDNDGVFNKIEYYSVLWKTELNKFSEKMDTLSNLFSKLSQQGLSIKSELTLNNWKKPESNIKFPQKTKDLLVLKKTINSELLNAEFRNIVKYRNIYNRIMKSLGRKFSSEIVDFVKTKQKGELLKQFDSKLIQQFVNKNAKSRIIKEIKAIDYEQQ